MHNRLLKAGLEVIPRVGLSDFHVDFAVRWAGQPWVAVLLDGPEWAQRSTVGDRDALPQSVLVGTMGWSEVERIWLPEWLRDAEAVVERIRSAAESAAKHAQDAPDQTLTAPHTLNQQPRRRVNRTARTQKPLNQEPMNQVQSG